MKTTILFAMTFALDVAGVERDRFAGNAG